MTAFFIGCSFTYGDDLPDPGKEAWPVLVAEQKQMPFVNAAVGGGSNERTVYHTIKNIDQFDKFYIAWTSIARFTRYRPDNNFEINFNPQLSHGTIGNDPDFLNYGKLHYKSWYNELYAFKLWLQQIIILQCYLGSKNKSWIMINTFDNNIKKWTSGWNNFIDSVKSLVCFDNMDDDQLYQEHLEIQNLLKQIDIEKFLGWNSLTIRNLVSGMPSGLTGHPLAQGHQAIAEYILKHDTN